MTTKALHDSSEETDRELAAVRSEIETADRDLVAAAARRVSLGRREADLRRQIQRPAVDFAYERSVLDGVRDWSSSLGLDPVVAEDLVSRVFEASLELQEADDLRHAGTGAGSRAVVVGGGGRMGRWMRGFLEAQGYSVAALDPCLEAVDNERAEEWLPKADLVLCAAPPRAVAEIYERWAEAPPQGVVADLASIKAPLLGSLGRLQEAGGRVASFHPMFGPSKVLLRGADVLICETGDTAATVVVEALFRPTAARLVRVGLTEHDQLMADLLGLAHAAAIAFAAALPEADHPVRSTTFQALEDLAAKVVQESPDVYYEIQAHNPHSLAALEKLRRAVAALERAVREERPDAFRRLMELGRRRTSAVSCHWDGEVVDR